MYFDTIYFLIFMTITLTLFRYSFQFFIIRYLQLWTKVPKKNHKKFSESAWKLLYYTFSWIWSLEVVVKKDFFWNTKLCWNVNGDNLEESFRYYFLFQLSFYIHSMIAQLTIEVRRKDFYQMVLHHLVTILLIGLSYYKSHALIGGVLLVFHDICDIFLEAAKLCHYYSWERLGIFFFICLVVVWICCRLILFPVKVLYSSVVESVEIVGWEVAKKEYYFLFNFMLFTIQLLNIYWFFLIARIVWNTIFNKEQITDIRED
jgi:hypothetical protein